MKTRRIFSLLLFLCCIATLLAAPRVVYTINESWHFAKDNSGNAWNPSFDDSSWEIVAVPHTWNAQDADDEVPGFYKGPGWYRKNIHISQDMVDRQVVIYFEGANQETDVYVNGQKAGRHIGGYTRFSFDITPFVKFGTNNSIAVKVDNSSNADIPPLSADFTFFGGIYRDVYLMYTDKVHISTDDYASSGVYVRTPRVSEKEAVVSISTLLDNQTDKTVKVRVQNLILSPDGKEMARKESIVKLSPKVTLNVEQDNILIGMPQLWSPEIPNLYTVHTRILDAKGKMLLDEVRNPLGLRWFSFSPESGFFLNGKPYKLIGTNRHQDYYKKGWALRDEMHVRDVKLLKEMGGNFLRVAHYPQDPVIMEMCDKLGILTSVEIPIVNAITESEGFKNNSLEMAREMIRQDFNRPSVIIWTYMNEVMLRPPFKSDPERHKTYCAAVGKLGKEIEGLLRKEDPSRYTMIPFHGSVESYVEAGLTDVPMIIGWNLYQGWYSGEFGGFDKFVESVHKRFPTKSMIITEYGADVDPRLHSFTPQRFDFTGEYGNLYHEHYLKTILKCPYIAGATIWNLNAFYSEGRADVIPHVNNKGITGLDRELKDTYLLYQAYLAKQPVINVGNRSWKNRGGIANEQGVCPQKMKVYTNSPQVEMLLNGVSLGKVSAKDHIAEFNVPFKAGINRIEAVGSNNNETSVKDLVEVNFQMLPFCLDSKENPFTELNVMLGSDRYFEDRSAAMVWLPEKEYIPGSWGYVGGERYIKKTRHGSQPASEIDILGTEDDPVFQTQRVGLEAFKLDVPNGTYAIYCYWAELDSNKKREALAYNLGNDAIERMVEKRIFDISINGNKVLTNLNLTEDFGAERAAIRKFVVEVSDGKGINLNFVPKAGEPVLNALRVCKMY